MVETNVAVSHYPKSSEMKGLSTFTVLLINRIRKT